MSNTVEGIEGKIVVITGASSGLGEATARYLSLRGATVVLGARRLDRIDALAPVITTILPSMFLAPSTVLLILPFG